MCAGVGTCVCRRVSPRIHSMWPRRPMSSIMSAAASSSGDARSASTCPPRSVSSMLSPAAPPARPDHAGTGAGSRTRTQITNYDTHTHARTSAASATTPLELERAGNVAKQTINDFDWQKRLYSRPTQAMCASVPRFPCNGAQRVANVSVSSLSSCINGGQRQTRTQMSGLYSRTDAEQLNFYGTQVTGTYASTLSHNCTK